MLDGRRLIFAALMALTAFTAGCPIGLVVTGTTTGYIAGSEPGTEALTNVSHVWPVADVENVVTEWMNRGQLPLPVLDDGVHTFYLRQGKFTPARGGLGARVVELLDGQQVVAEYAVAWDRTPVEYRLLWARNLLYDGELDVSKVPVLKTYDIQ